MKRCLTLQIKYDREQAVTLNTIALQTQKMDKIEPTASLVVRCRDSSIDKPENIIKDSKTDIEENQQETHRLETAPNIDHTDVPGFPQEETEVIIVR